MNQHRVLNKLLSPHRDSALTCGIGVVLPRIAVKWTRKSRPVAAAFRESCSDLNRFSISVALQVLVHPVKSIPKARRVTNMIAEGTKDFSPAYSAWLNKPVVLLVVIRRCHVPMPCRIVGESVADVRVRLQPGWEMDIKKELILAVEEVVVAPAARVN
jgi:hypothetical protein